MDLGNRLITLDMEISELYEIFLHETLKKGENDLLNKVRNGIDLKFNIENWIKGRYIEKTFRKIIKGKEVGEDIQKVFIDKKEFEKVSFEDEIIKRARAMRSWLWENMTLEKPGEVGGSDDGK